MNPSTPGGVFILKWFVVLKYLPLVLKNSLRSRRRSLLTILSIALSLCLLGVLGALYFMFYLSEASDQQALRLVVRNRVSLARPLPFYYGQRIRQVPGVDEVIILQWFNGTYKDARDMRNFFARFATEPEKLFTVYPEYQVPPDQRQAFIEQRTACMVGRKLAQRLGFQLGDRITILGDIYPVDLEFVVRAIYDSERDNENLFFHYDYLSEALGDSYFSDQVGNFSLRAARAEDVPGIAEAVDAMFRNSTVPTKTETERQFEVSFLAYLGNVKLFLLAICSAVTFTILLVSGNTMAMSIRERVREVGILKTLGFTRRTILALIISEAVTMALIGGVIGLLIADGLCRVLRTMPSMYADMGRVQLPASMWGVCLAVAVLVGVLSSIMPAWGAARRPIVEALRFND